MLDDFMIRALLAGLGVILATAPLGCFVVWRRMAYFGDATSHSAVLGVAFALAFSLPVFAGVLAVALVMALLVTRLSDHGYGVNTILGVFAHGALAIGLVVASLAVDTRIDLMAFLFGDILTVSLTDLALIWGGGAAVSALILTRWSRLLISSMSPDLAHANGIDPEREKLILTLCLALVVAVAIKIVGALLISALLIIPAAAARPVARGPEAMAALASLIGIACVIAGLAGAYYADTPAGPSIIAAATAAFAITTLAGRLRRG